MGNGQVLQHIFIVFVLLCHFQSQCQSQLNRSSSTTSKPRGPHLLCHPQQNRALLQFKSHFVTDPQASSYCTNNLSEGAHNRTGTWNESRDCCSSWDGVTCNAVTGQVIGLDLSCSMLKLQLSNTSHGIFSSLFASIPNLQILNLAGNDFQYMNMSTLSLGFASLPSLTHLILSHSNLSGYVPSDISHLSKLVSLDLSSNYDLRFESTTVLKSLAQNLTHLRVLNLEYTSLLALPNSATCLMNLSFSLTSLSLSDSGLEGTFPESFLLLPNLLELHLSGNSNLSGSLPKLSNSTSLEVLGLSKTSLSGELPADSIGNLNSLQSLHLHSCNFSGSIPASLGNLTQITWLYLSDNHLSGAIPSSLGYLSKLYGLYLHMNHLSGAIPSSFGQLNQLSFLNLHHNTLTGQIPNAVLNLTQIKAMDLSSNLLEGSLPTSPGQLSPYLSTITLSNNSLSGPIPSWLFALPSLTDIVLNSNHLSGPLSEFMSPSLWVLDLSNNKLNGAIPEPISRSVYLESLDLSHNFLTGSVGEFPEVGSLDLHSNLLEGSLPVPSSETIYFSVANNNFRGEVPSLICKASSLLVLDLSFNSLSGTIPKCLGNFTTSLEVLNLCMNNFHGTIPNTFAKCGELTYLNLNGNQLRGGLPRSLANCDNLEAVDVDDNSIVDVFPRWMQSLQQLQVLVLRSNKFYGHVDIDLEMNTSFPKLRILDLSNNSFSGTLPTKLIKSLKGMINVSEDQGPPQYMGTSDGFAYRYSVTVTMKGVDMPLVNIFIAFTTIDMSNNKFDGNTPPVIGSLHALKGLNLSHNYLSGPIPPSFGKLVNLEWLDLSSNKLVGLIPSQLLDLNSLAVLNLSHNHLRGPIPVGKQFNTFKDESYVGNSGLCGFPLPKCGSKSSSPPTQSASSEESASTFSWKSSYVGYGCGTIFGMAIGYLVFSTGSPQWIVKMVEGERQTKGRRLRRNAKARGRRATN